MDLLASPAKRIAIGGLLLLSCAVLAADTGRKSVTAVVNVNVVPMTTETVLSNQTVIVSDGRISAVGPTAVTPITSGANVIDGQGKYLMPGLADMHVHLEGRSGFGDAPLFLAYGITTVLNLRGRSEILEWKRAIEEGRLLAPNLYTSGEFVNEPRVKSPQDAEDEVIRQKAAGYDVIKFHEVVVDGQYVTQRGLSRPSYDAMNQTARRIGIPLIGHAPDNLGLQAVLDDHQSLAHSGILVALYFVPHSAVERLLWPSLLSFGLTLLTAIGIAIAAIAGRQRGPAAPNWKTPVTTAAFCVIFVLLWPTFGLLLGSTPFLVLLSAVALLIVFFAFQLSKQVYQSWRWKKSSTLVLVLSTVVALASAGFALSLGIWLPLAWRTSEWNLNAFAAKCRQAGIFVEPTLCIYQNIEAMRLNRTADLLSHPVNRYLRPETRSGWSHIPNYRPPFKEKALGFLFRHNLALCERITGRLQRAGVPLMVGTDAFGFPFCIPGKSAHDEMDLMHESGLTLFEVLRSATVNPAKFLGKESEFGTVEIGKRADLLLVKGNPLRGLETIREPEGVMVRGIWLRSDKLREMLVVLSN